MIQGHTQSRSSGPDITAIPFGAAARTEHVALLDDHQRRELARIASVVRIKPGEPLYKQGARADAIYNLIDGVVATFQRTGRRRIVTAFLFAHDLVGLCEAGRYVNSAQAITPVSAYRMPLASLERLLKRDPLLEHQFLCKLCHELRESQRHAIAVSNRSAGAKLASLLRLLERREPPELRNGLIYLPMKRSDIAAYLGLSLESVGRTLASFEHAGTIAVTGRRYVKILDRKAFDTLASAG